MIECRHLVKDFLSPYHRVLDDLSFRISDGEFISISGASGSGKSTLLYLLSSLDNPTSGEVLFDGKNIQELNLEEQGLWRTCHVGFIFQFHYLLPELTVMENVLLPARNLKVNKVKEDLALMWLEKLGIAKLKNRFSSQISGGEQQRVAIARALILSPRYLFADEPTGNLDSHNAMSVMNILKDVHHHQKMTICLVTHEKKFSLMADREIYLVDGKISERSR